MEAKTFEVRDEGTFMPILAVRLNPSCERDRYLLGRAGYGGDPQSQGEYFMVCRIAGGTGTCSSDPYEHGSARTMKVAHDYIEKNWSTLESGALIDVEYILGETSAPKKSEQEEDLFV